MALVRAIALKDASVTAVSSGGNGTIFDLSSLFTSGATQKLYAGVHVTTQSTDSFVVMVQSASSSGANFGTLATTEFSFTAMTARGAQWGSSTPFISSTDRKFFRTRWTLSTGSNSPSVTFIDWVSIR